MPRLNDEKAELITAMKICLRSAINACFVLFGVCGSQVVKHMVSQCGLASDPATRMSLDTTINEVMDIIDLLSNPIEVLSTKVPEEGLAATMDKLGVWRSNVVDLLSTFREHSQENIVEVLPAIEKVLSAVSEGEGLAMFDVCRGFSWFTVSSQVKGSFQDLKRTCAGMLREKKSQTYSDFDARLVPISLPKEGLAGRAGLPHDVGSAKINHDPARCIAALLDSDTSSIPKLEKLHNAFVQALKTLVAWGKVPLGEEVASCSRGSMQTCITELKTFCKDIESLRALQEVKEDDKEEDKEEEDKEEDKEEEDKEDNKEEEDKETEVDGKEEDEEKQGEEEEDKEGTDHRKPSHHVTVVFAAKLAAFEPRFQEVKNYYKTLRTVVIVVVVSVAIVFFLRIILILILNILF